MSERVLDPGTLYVIEEDAGNLYARTPDGVGCYWYEPDRKDEAMGDVCEVERVMVFASGAEFDDYRWPPE